MALPDDSNSAVSAVVPRVEVIILRPLAMPPAPKNWESLQEYLLYRSADEMLDYMASLHIPLSVTISINGALFTPLLAAIQYRFLSIAKKLIASGADVNQEVNDFVPLSLAISLHKCKTANYILSLRQTDVNRQTRSGRTAMLAAFQTNSQSLVYALFAKGAKLPIFIDLPFKVSYEMKSLLISLGRDRVVLYLLKEHLKQHILLRLPFSLVRLLISYV